MTDTKKYIDLLNETHEFPTTYLFKFIIRSEQITQLKEFLPNEYITQNLSKTGKYVSCNLRKKVESAEEILEMYKNIQKIEGVISL